MGKQISKEERKDVIITQNAVGENSGSASVQEQQEHLRVNTRNL